MITQQQIKSIYIYDPDSGEITRKDGRKCGHVAHNGYLRFSVKGTSYSALRLIWLYMTGELPTCDVDHINHNRLDNRWSNVRLASRQENMRNATLSKASTSGFTGITWCKQQGQWAAQICIDGMTKKLGRYDCKIDAVAARIRANKKYGFHPNHGSAYAEIQDT